MEESYRLTRIRINRGHVSTFVTITENARIRQIIESRRTSVLAADDMIDLVSKAGIVFMNAAVLATMSGPAGDVGAKSCR